MSDKRVFTPNTFQVPNLLVDEIMKDLKNAELRCYLVVIRKTTGWHKTSDKIPVAQITEVTGIKRKQTIYDAMKNLEKLGLIERHQNPGGWTEYSLTTGEGGNKNCYGGSNKNCYGGSNKNCYTSKDTNSKDTNSKDTNSKDIDSAKRLQELRYKTKRLGSKARLGSLEVVEALEYMSKIDNIGQFVHEYEEHLRENGKYGKRLINFMSDYVKRDDESVSLWC